MSSSRSGKLKKAPLGGLRAKDANTLKAQIAKQKSRVSNAMLILALAWIGSSYWTFNGLILTAQETATAGFVGVIQALIASIISAVVVAGCCSMLLGFSGAGETDE